MSVATGRIQMYWKGPAHLYSLMNDFLDLVCKATNIKIKDYNFVFTGNFGNECRVRHLQSHLKITCWDLGLTITSGKQNHVCL